MLTIKTKPDCTLGFVPMDIKFSPITPESYDGEKVNPYHIDEVFIINTDKSKIIGKLSEITEEQARELVKSSNLKNQGIAYHIDPLENIYSRTALIAIQAAVLSVGIEEKDFDKYVVVKL